VDLQDYDFTLPPELIAQFPAARRDQSRLMIVDRAQQVITHDIFANIGKYLRPGDVLVLNDTKVIPARLRGRRAATGGKVEVLLLHEIAPGEWQVLLKPAAKVQRGAQLEFAEGVLRGEVLERLPEQTMRVRFTPTDMHDLLEQYGEIPLPPYIRRASDALHAAQDRLRYQTVYARHPGAVAAPTAGLHFTPELLTALEQQGIRRATITLHVGQGTFQPVRATQVEAHRMGKEFYRVETDQAALIEQARAAGGRVVAVGTTATRTLETQMQAAEKLTAGSGWSELFIYPPYQFRIVDGLLTNFHLPRSTLFLLVCAFAGRELMCEAYRVAVAKRYRFYSYGDAMFIW
jgi:S-adenosylmethionine:tRNA ribosyltransferase-isomerase